MTATADRLSSQLLNEHPLRAELHDELHARPSLYFEGDSDVWHVAILGSQGPPAVPEAFSDLSDVSSTQDGRHGIGTIPGGRLKWELHTEFLTLTFVAPAASDSLSQQEFKRLSGLAPLTHSARFCAPEPSPSLLGAGDDLRRVDEAQRDDQPD
ncbi:DUF3422 domain-containing protein [Bosea sp. F3-2]|uniref:DUF3422 family protein n=1 Tax=Bosea sp. F3-2 TaxID=2599640 RepID=UPI0011F041F0|nr:DUF3422 family protein [Bosea sp. F3-2]QEL22999.1 DUF3422 domain-containing protein [Bosea sp. F3-2]